MTEQQPLPWAKMDGPQQSAAIDTIAAMFKTTLQTLVEGVNDDLTARGVPYRLQVKVDLLPRKLLPQEMSP
jgi:hypothetical protein